MDEVAALERRLAQLEADNAALRLELNTPVFQDAIPAIVFDVELAASQVLGLLAPVAVCICMCTAIARTLSLKDLRTFPLIFDAEKSEPEYDPVVGAVLNTLAFVGVVVAASLLFLVLFWGKCVKLIQGLIMLLFIAGFGALGGYLFWLAAGLYDWPVDYLSFAFAGVNSTAAGLVAIFVLHGPSKLSQACSITVCSFLASTFLRLDSLSVVLILLVVGAYDYVAVTCGPIGAAMRAAQKHTDGVNIPGLLYSAGMLLVTDDMSTGSDGGDFLISATEQPDTASAAAEGVGTVAYEAPLLGSPANRGLKLGLGDFIFYGVAAIVAARSNSLLPVIVCSVLMLHGLLLTLFRLTSSTRALPALPIPLLLGGAGTAVCVLAVTPFITTMFMEGLVVA